MIASEIIRILNLLAPEKLIERKWDNSGLQIGQIDREVKKILIVLDISPSTVKFALDNNIDMIVSHHPFFFKPVKSIVQNSVKGKMITDLIKNDIIVYSIHTNLDSSREGVNEILSQKLNLRNIKILNKTYTEKLYKIVTFVPHSHSDIVRKAMTECGAGFIGNYSHCTFNIKGKGSFMPREGTNPYIGDINKLEYVEEERIETIVSEKELANVIQSMLSVHPYEEVAYDVYELYNRGSEYGYGRIGLLDKELKLVDLAKNVKQILGCESVTIYGNSDNIVKRVAVCGGSGADFIKDAYYNKSDVYITGDIKYHDAQMALENGVSLIDAGHFYTERAVLPYIKEFIEENVKENIHVMSYCGKSFPFMTV